MPRQKSMLLTYASAAHRAGTRLRTSGGPGDLSWGPPQHPAAPSPYRCPEQAPTQAYKLWQGTPSPPASSAGCADPRAHLQEARAALSSAGRGSAPCPAPGPAAARLPPPGAHLGRCVWTGGSRAEPPRTPRPPSSPPPPRRSCCWGNPSSATARETRVSSAGGGRVGPCGAEPHGRGLSPCPGTPAPRPPAR